MYSLFLSIICKHFTKSPLLHFDTFFLHSSTHSLISFDCPGTNACLISCSVYFTLGSMTIDKLDFAFINISFNNSILHKTGSFRNMPKGTRTRPSKYCFDLLPWSSALLFTSFNFMRALSFTLSLTFISKTCCSRETLDTSQFDNESCVNSIV